MRMRMRMRMGKEREEGRLHDKVGNWLTPCAQHGKVKVKIKAKAKARAKSTQRIAERTHVKTRHDKQTYLSPVSDMVRLVVWCRVSSPACHRFAGKSDGRWERGRRGT
jgi:hypothetical protein